MVNAAKSYFGFADGGVISKGNVVPYANGGIVGSPTYFPMAGGRTGLMGEAGPEAIMPLKRGKNGKLGVQVDGGQQQSVVVNQSFNFQANGDDSVKRIIAQQAPKIAQMTQQQIMDSRRRGGQMKAVFG
jgi:lambda family phage tail tape measure protein